MSSNYTVIFDANVLYPAPLRSFLMYLALSGEFRARWTDMIHEEWIRNLLTRRPDMERSQLERVRDLMNLNVPGSVVTGFEPLIDGIALPDKDDRHVVGLLCRSGYLLLWISSRVFCIFLARLRQCSPNGSLFGEPGQG